MRANLICIATLLAGPAAADVFTFETPSGNIDCSVGVGQGGSDIGCTIYEKSGADALPRPANCPPGYWGHTVVMLNSGPVQMVCEAPGQNGKMFEEAPYGVSATWDGITCVSETTGFQCTNLDGHGFFLSRRVQRVW